MGGQRAYLKSGGFDEYLYHQIGEVISTNGMSGKVLKKEGDDRSHEGLPMFSNSSTVYFKLDDETGLIEQARIYRDRKVIADFDWGHNHGEFKEGTVHVHEWRINKHGKWVRGNNPRLMSNEEVSVYGELLKKAYGALLFK